MIRARDAVVWVNKEAGEVSIRPHGSIPGGPGHVGWCDPIGAAYAQWQKMNDKLRVQLMLETAIDLAMQGIPLANTLRAFATVQEFRALGNESVPMCRALTSALVGQCLEPNTMSFEELLTDYAPKEVA